MANLWKKLCLLNIMVLLFCGSMAMVSCGDDDDSQEQTNSELEDNEGEGPTVSNYKASDLYGVWTQTQSADASGVTIYDDPRNEYGITFQSDGIHGRNWNLRNGSVRNLDFKWSFKNDCVYIIELNTGNEFDYTITLMNSKKTLIMEYRNGDYWTLDTYIKK